MLHKEFAVDPDQIQDIRDIRLLEARFGYEKGALISAFPKKWFKQVAEKLTQGLSGTQADNITDDLKVFKSNAIMSFSREFIPGAWVDSAKENHHQNPFHRLVERSLNAPPELLPSIYDLRDRDFQVTPQTFRSASAMAEASALLLRNAEKVTLVDPYFCLSKPGYRNTLIELMERCQKERVSFHIFSEEEGKTCWSSSRKPALKDFVDKHLPKSFSLRWFSISDNDSGYIHARGLFTGKGGIRYDRGFEAPNDHDQQRTAADIGIMEISEWEQKVKDYDAVQLPEIFDLKHYWSSQ